MDEDRKDELGQLLDELVQNLKKVAEPTSPEDDATFIAGLDQQRATVRTFVAKLINEVREHQQTCSDIACVGIPVMASSAMQIMNNPKSVLGVLWETLHQLANLPDYNPNQELEEVLKL